MRPCSTASNAAVVPGTSVRRGPRSCAGTPTSSSRPSYVRRRGVRLSADVAAKYVCAWDPLRTEIVGEA